MNDGYVYRSKASVVLIVCCDIELDQHSTGSGTHWHCCLYAVHCDSNIDVLGGLRQGVAAPAYCHRWSEYRFQLSQCCHLDGVRESGKATRGLELHAPLSLSLHQCVCCHGCRCRIFFHTHSRCGVRQVLLCDTLSDI